MLCENLCPPSLLLSFSKKTDINLVLIKPLSNLALSGLSCCSVGLLGSIVPLLSHASPNDLEMTQSVICPGWTTKCHRNLSEGKANLDLTLNYFN